MEEIHQNLNSHQLLEREYKKIHQAANDFLLKLPDDNIRRAISLAAALAGLKLLRASEIDLTKYNAGNALLGAVPDEKYQLLQRFMFGWARSNGLSPKPLGVTLSSEDKKYLPEVVQLEDTFNEICRQNNLIPEHFPFPAITAALKLVLVGKKMGLLDENTGQLLTLFHVISGSKIVPYSTMSGG